MNYSEASSLARTLMDEYGLQDWTFAFDRSKSRFGLCSHRNQTISLSFFLVGMNDEENVRNTIFHEIAHALAPANAKAHGSEWVTQCLRVGINPRVTYDSDLVSTPEPKFIGTCPRCGNWLRRHRRSRGMERIACTPCCKRFNGGTYSPDLLFVWKEVGA